MESKHNANSDQQPPPAEVQPETEPRPAAAVKMCAYEFLDAALRDSLPTRWSNGVGKAESITLDSPTSPIYTGYGDDIRYLEGSVRTNIPIPAKLEAYYYEVTIVNEGPDKTIAIGFGRNHKNMKSLPGWQADDRAFNLVNGCFYYGDCTNMDQFYNGCPIEDGAVYGCGVDFIKNVMFFTRNGVIIACKSPKYKMTFAKGHLYPVVGLCGLNTQLDTNFGEKRFLFDFQHYYNGGFWNMLFDKRPIKRRQSMAAENPGPSKIPCRNLSITLPNLDDSLNAENAEHVPAEQIDVKPRVSPSENAQQIETERDVTLGENEHLQTNATSNVTDNTAGDPNLPHSEPYEARTVKTEIKESDESNGPSDEFDINEVLDLISRGNAQEAEAKIIASEFGPFYESDPELVLFLKIQVLMELWKGNEETYADDQKIYLLGKTISSLAHGIPSLGAGIQQKVEDSLRLSFCAKKQVLEKHKYLLLPEEHQKVANLIEMAFIAYKARKAARDASMAYQNLMRSN